MATLSAKRAGQWRRGRELNPRYLSVNMISSHAHSATLPPLRGRCDIPARRPTARVGASRPSRRGLWPTRFPSSSLCFVSKSSLTEHDKSLFHTPNPRLSAVLQEGITADSPAAASRSESSPYPARHTVSTCSPGGASSPSEPQTKDAHGAAKGVLPSPSEDQGRILILALAQKSSVDVTMRDLELCARARKLVFPPCEKGEGKELVAMRLAKGKFADLNRAAKSRSHFVQQVP